MKTAKKISIALTRAFPDISGICPGEEKGFSEGSVFLGNAAEGGEIDGLPACDHYSFEFDPNEKTYVMGVHKKLIAFLEGYEYFVECHDPGTFIAYEG